MQAFRRRLPADAAGRVSGTSPRQRVAETWLMMAPAALVALFLYQCGGVALQEVAGALRHGGGPSVPMGRGILPRFFIVQSLVVGYVAVALAMASIMWLVPTEVR